MPAKPYCHRALAHKPCEGKARAAQRTPTRAPLSLRHAQRHHRHRERILTKLGAGRFGGEGMPLAVLSTPREPCTRAPTLFRDAPEYGDEGGARANHVACVRVERGEHAAAHRMCSDGGEGAVRATAREGLAPALPCHHTPPEGQHRGR
jgi:hypothetical protein